MLELYRKHVWTDAKTVNAIAAGCLSKSSKMVIAASKFMLDLEFDKEELEENESDQEDKKVELRRQLGSKLPKKKKDELRKMLKLLERKQKRKVRKVLQSSFLPMDQIYDSQGFTEKLFAKLTKGKGKKKMLKGEVAALVLDLVAKMIGRHKLNIPEYFFYTNHLIKAKNKNIAKVLASIAEACHDNLQHDDIKDVAGTIIDNMISEHCQPEFITMGLNSIREIALRMPQVITEDQLAYLVQFKDYKNKYVCAAAKSVINAYRDINPMMLPRKLRGIEKTVDNTQGGIPGLVSFPVEEGKKVTDKILTDEELKELRAMQLGETARTMGHVKGKKDVLEIIKEYSKDMRKKYMEDDIDDIKLAGKRAKAEGEDEIPEFSDAESEEFNSEDNESEDEEWSEESVDDEELDEYFGEEEVPEEENEEKKEVMVDESESEEDVYANQGFINVENIDTFKKPKKERIKQELTTKVREPHRKHIRQKTGSTSNQEKARRKPYMMVLPKKKSEVLRAKYKSVKERIKDLQKKSKKIRQGKLKVTRKIYVKS
jgi:protein SDA1